MHVPLAEPYPRRLHVATRVLWALVAGLLGLYLVVYLALFSFVFPPRQAFRYRIPIEPVLFVGQAAVLAIAARWFAASREPRA